MYILYSSKVGRSVYAYVLFTCTLLAHYLTLTTIYTIFTIYTAPLPTLQVLCLVFVQPLVILYFVYWMGGKWAFGCLCQSLCLCLCIPTPLNP
jgi:hypothetical protein